MNPVQKTECRQQDTSSKAYTEKYNRHEFYSYVTECQHWLKFWISPKWMLLFICEWKKEKKVVGSDRQLDEFGINLFAVTTHLHVIIEPADTAQYAGLLVKQESVFGTNI